MAARSSIDLEFDVKSIVGRACSTRRANWCGRRGPTRSISRNGGGRTASRTTTSAFDFKPGGVWRFVMHGPDGRDYENRVTFDEIVKPERIAYHHGGGDDVEPVQFRTTVTFEDIGGKTRRLHDCAGVFAVGRGARARHQGIRRRQGPRADAGAARRIRGEGVIGADIELTARPRPIRTKPQGEYHASSTLPVLRRPLRRGARLLQEGARRQGRDDDALQGQSRTRERSCAPRHRGQDHARLLQRRRHGGAWPPTATPRATRSSRASR